MAFLLRQITWSLYCGAETIKQVENKAAAAGRSTCLSLEPAPVTNVEVKRLTNVNRVD